MQLILAHGRPKRVTDEIAGPMSGAYAPENQHFIHPRPKFLVNQTPFHLEYSLDQTVLNPLEL